MRLDQHDLRFALPVAALLAAAGCGFGEDAGGEVSAASFEAQINGGNARGAYGNARGAYGNGRGAFGNARGAFGNASVFGAMATALYDADLPWYVVSDHTTPIVQPRTMPSSAFSGCGDFTRSDALGNITEWKFGRTYRIGATSYTSDLQVRRGTSSSWSSLSIPSGSEYRLPAKVTTLGSDTAALDAVVTFSAKRSSYYQCSPEYRVLVYDVKVQLVIDGTCSTDVIDMGTVTAFPAVKSLMRANADANASTLEGLQAKGGGWAILVGADVDSAAFKSLHYATAVIDFQNPSDTDGWRYRYPTSNTSCQSSPSSCVDGASLVTAYMLALTNMVPMQLSTSAGTTIVGHPGTTTGYPIYISATMNGATLRKTDFEHKPTAASPNRPVALQLAPGTVEQATPYRYDAAFGPPRSASSNYLGSVRWGYGANQVRFDRIDDVSSPYEAGQNRNLAVTSFDQAYGMAPTATQSPNSILSLSQAAHANLTFLVSSLPANDVNACLPPPDRPLDVPGTIFVIESSGSSSGGGESGS